MRGFIEQARTIGWKAKATALGLTVFVVWILLLNVGPLANRPGRIVLSILAAAALLVGTAWLTPRRRS